MRIPFPFDHFFFCFLPPAAAAAAGAYSNQYPLPACPIGEMYLTITFKKIGYFVVVDNVMMMMAAMKPLFRNPKMCGEELTETWRN